MVKLAEVVEPEEPMDHPGGVKVAVKGKVKKKKNKATSETEAALKIQEDKSKLKKKKNKATSETEAALKIQEDKSKLKKKKNKATSETEPALKIQDDQSKLKKKKSKTASDPEAALKIQDRLSKLKKKKHERIGKRFFKNQMKAAALEISGIHLIKLVYNLLESYKCQTGQPENLVAGCRQVCKSIEQNEAKLVVIAGDAEVVGPFPDLCQKMQIPYVVVDQKKQLGSYINTNNCAVLALTQVTPQQLRPITKKISKAAGEKKTLDEE